MTRRFFRFPFPTRLAIIVFILCIASPSGLTRVNRNRCGAITATSRLGKTFTLRSSPQGQDFRFAGRSG